MHGTFSRIDHILGHKSSLSKFKKIEIISSIFSDHNAMRLEINYSCGNVGWNGPAVVSASSLSPGLPRPRCPAAQWQEGRRSAMACILKHFLRTFCEEVEASKTLELDDGKKRDTV